MYYYKMNGIHSKKMVLIGC